MLTAVTLVAGILLFSLMFHLLFGTGPMEWLDNFNVEVEQEAKDLQEPGPIEVPLDPEAARITAILPSRKEAFSKEHRDTIPCGPPIMETPKVVIDDPLTEAVANVRKLKGVSNAEALLQLLHQQVCQPQCGGPVRKEGTFTCDCGSIENLLARTTGVVSGVAQGKRYSVQQKAV